MREQRGEGAGPDAERRACREGWGGAARAGDAQTEGWGGLKEGLKEDQWVLKPQLQLWAFGVPLRHPRGGQLHLSPTGRAGSQAWRGSYVLSFGLG